MADCQGYAHCAYAKAGAATIFIHNGAPQALVGCYENRMAGCGLMHLAHTADTRADVIFIDNGAPEVLVGCHDLIAASAEILSIQQSDDSIATPRVS